MKNLMDQTGSTVLAGLGIVALVAAVGAGAFMLGMQVQNPLDREIISLAGDGGGKSAGRKIRRR